MHDNVIDFRRIHRRPTSLRQARLEALRAAEAAHEAADPIVRASSGASPIEVLHAQLVELAVEAAALRFDRLHASSGAKDRGRLISRRVRALRCVADAAIELHHLGDGASSPAATRRVLELLTDDILAASREVLDGATAQHLETAVRQRVEPMLDELVAEPR